MGREDGTERQLAVLRHPAVVGELAFLLGEKRSASVRAQEEVTVREVGAGLLRRWSSSARHSREADRR